MKYTLKQRYNDLKLSASYVDHEDGTKTTPLQIVVEMVKEIVAETICKIFGHKMVDHSYGGPDSGFVSVDCERCGYGVKTTLY
jgi:hypothetical protein